MLQPCLTPSKTTFPWGKNQPNKETTKNPQQNKLNSNPRQKFKEGAAFRSLEHPALPSCSHCLNHSSTCRIEQCPNYLCRNSRQFHKNRADFTPAGCIRRDHITKKSQCFCFSNGFLRATVLQESTAVSSSSCLKYRCKSITFQAINFT